MDKVAVMIRHDITGLHIEVVPSANPDDWPLGKIELPADQVWTTTPAASASAAAATA